MVIEEDRKMNVCILGQDNWVGLEILGLGKLGPECDHDPGRLWNSKNRRQCYRECFRCLMTAKSNIN